MISSDFPITPEIYKGRYNVHGIRVIDMYYNVTPRSIIGRKVAGDFNVPCNEITFQVCLTDPIVFPENVVQVSNMKTYLKKEHISTDFSDVCFTDVSCKFMFDGVLVVLSKDVCVVIQLELGSLDIYCRAKIIGSG